MTDSTVLTDGTEILMGNTTLLYIDEGLDNRESALPPTKSQGSEYIEHLLRHDYYARKKLIFQELKTFGLTHSPGSNLLCCCVCCTFTSHPSLALLVLEVTDLAEISRTGPANSSGALDRARSTANTALFGVRLILGQLS